MARLGVAFLFSRGGLTSVRSMHCHVDCLPCGPTTHYYRSLRRRYVCAYLLDPPPVLSCACADVVLASVLSSVDCSITVVVVLWPRGRPLLAHRHRYLLPCSPGLVFHPPQRTRYTPRTGHAILTCSAGFFLSSAAEKHSCYSVLGGRNTPSSSCLGCLI